MNRHKQSIIYFFIALTVVSGCSQEIKTQESGTNNWNPNTKTLDAIAKRDPSPENGGTLAHDVKNFYQLLRDKKWHETYQLRAKVYRDDTLESDYVAEAEKRGKAWGLVNYEVLGGTLQNTIGSTNVDEAVLICKFIELPGNAESYAAVFWHKEDGTWKCLSAGPSKLSIFQGTRVPYIDWR